MKTIYLTQEKFRTLQKYKLPDDLFIAESELYVLNYNNKNKLFKKFYITKGEIFENKLNTILSLEEYKDIINIDELTYPEALVMIDNEIVGYIMPLIPSVNLDIVLSDPNITIDRKITYLKQIGVILDKMDSVRNNTILKDFYLNDLHEANFVLDLTTDTIKVVDTDSCKINNNLSFSMQSKYLQSNSIITTTPKYIQDESFPYGCKIIPNKDTDLYCYIMIILNFLYGGAIEELSIEELYEYFEYLLSLGIDQNIIEIFKNITTNKPNLNPYQLLDKLIPYYEQTHKSIYNQSRKKY